MQTLGNTVAFIEAQQYSNFILMNLHDGILPTSFYRNVSDFGSGTTLNIKTIGTAQLQDVAENTPLIYNAIDTGTVTLTITEYVGDAFYITDPLRQDGAQIEALLAARAAEGTRALQENFETVFLQAANDAQTVADLNNINGFAHRRVASGTNDTMELNDLIDMKLAFDKANVPQGGRIAIVDPIVEATFNRKFTGTFVVDHNPKFVAVLEDGFVRDHKFIGNFFGFDFWTSNRLPRIADETINSVQVLTGVANVFMSILSDVHKPMMVAWRQQPRTESERNKDLQRDEFVTTARWGVGAQRVETLGFILTDETAVV